ncbi:MAG: DUF2851 family protein [Verrucomicrobiaceae bacterium]
MDYRQLLNAINDIPDTLNECSPRVSFDEIEVQSRWFAGYFPDTHQANTGQRIRIISPGEWNRGAGPDFLNAVIEIDGEQHQGPVELDIASRNWDLHGHSTNSNFNQVILHVVLHDDGPTYFTKTSLFREISRICLSRESVNIALGQPRLTQALARPGRCLRPLSQLASDAVERLLEEAARHRAGQKAARFRRTCDWHDFPQALWEAFADSLGFSANRLPMRLLAQRFPIKELTKLPAAHREAVLFGAAGFLDPGLHRAAPPESQEYLQSLWTHWWKLRDQHEFLDTRKPQWSTQATRPGNHPQRRLAALATASGQWKKIVNFSTEPPPYKSLTTLLASLTHPFWDCHHTLKSERTHRPIRVLGEARIREFVLNTLIPIHLDNKESGWNSYRTIPAGPPNQKIKRCCERLWGSIETAKPHLSKAWQHQAILQIYHDFCLEDASDCSDCPFPEQILQWK